MGKHLENRPDNMIKNRFYSHIKRNYILDTDSSIASSNRSESSARPIKVLRRKRSKSEDLLQKRKGP